MFIVMMNGELAENATMNLFSLFGIVTTKKHQLYSTARAGMPTREEIDDAST